MIDTKRIQKLMQNHIEKALENPIERFQSEEGFLCTSLKDWIKLCRKSQINRVSSEMIAEPDVDALLSFDEPTPEQHQELEFLYETIKQRTEPGFMVRWDCCAPFEVKYRLSRGEYGWRKEFLDLPIDEPRTFDMLFEYPRQTIPVWKRRWIQADIHESYPVEYRVFVRDSEILGASNYYPQRSLEGYSQALVDAEKAMDMTALLVSKMGPMTELPAMQGLDVNKAHCTVDWIKSEGQLLFLEGGPPHLQHWGAHPCCFEPGDISGIALKDRNTH